MTSGRNGQPSAFRFGVRTLMLLTALVAVGIAWRNEIGSAPGVVLYYPWYPGVHLPSLDDPPSRSFRLVAFSPDGTRLAAIGHTGRSYSEPHSETLTIWDVSERCLQAEGARDQKNIRHVLFSADGKTLVTVDVGESFAAGKTPPSIPAVAVRRDAHTLSEISRITIATTPLWSAALSPDGTRLVTGSGDVAAQVPGAVTVWDLNSGRRLAAAEVKSEVVTAVAYAPDGRTIVAGIGIPGLADEHPSQVMILDPESLQPLRPALLEPDSIASLAFSGDGKTLAVADGRSISVWDPATWKCRTTVEARRSLSALAVSRDGKLIAGGAYSYVGLWDTETGIRKGLLQLDRSDSVESLSFGRGDRLAVPSSADEHTPLILDLATGQAMDWTCGSSPNSALHGWAPVVLASVLLVVTALTAITRGLSPGRGSQASKRKVRLTAAIVGVCLLALGLILGWRTLCAIRLQHAIDKSSRLDQAGKVLLKTLVGRAVYSSADARLVDVLRLQGSNFELEFAGPQVLWNESYKDHSGRRRRVVLVCLEGWITTDTSPTYYCLAILDEHDRPLASEIVPAGELVVEPNLERNQEGRTALVVTYLPPKSHHADHRRFSLSGDCIREVFLKTTSAPPSLPAALEIERHGGSIQIHDRYPPSGYDVSFWGAALDDRALEELAPSLEAMVGLVDLELRQTRVTSAGLKSVRRLKSLRRLSLDAMPVDDAGLVHLEDLHDLESLELWGTPVKGTGLANLKRCWCLTRLDLTRASVTDSGLTGLRELTTLKFLYLGYNAISDAGLENLKGLTALEHLDLGGTHVRGRGLRSLAALHDLETLSLDNSPIHGLGLEALEQLKKLRRLVLNGTTVTDDDMKAIALLPWLSQLELAGTQVGDSGLAHLKTLRMLEYLDLERTRITDSAFNSLLEMPSLRVLNLEQTGITRDGLEQFKRCCPPKLDPSQIRASPQRSDQSGQ